MAYPKKVNALNVDTKERVVRAYAKHVQYILAKVESVGEEDTRKKEKWRWLCEAYDKILKFAEDVQLKEMPTELTGGGELIIKIVEDGRKNISAPSSAV